MCGQVHLSSDVSEIKLVFGIPPDRPMPNFAPSWNATPTDQLPIVLFDEGRRAQLRLGAGLGTVPGQGHQSRLRQHKRQGRVER